VFDEIDPRDRRSAEDRIHAARRALEPPVPTDAEHSRPPHYSDLKGERFIQNLPGNEPLAPRRNHGQR